MKKLMIKRDGITTISGMRGHGKTSLAKRILVALIKAKHTVIVYDPMQEYPKEISYNPRSDSKEEFNLFLKHIWNTGNVFVVIDEAERYLSVRQPLVEYAAKIVNTGRHRNIGLLVITRRLAELNKTVFGLSDKAIFFTTYLPNDNKYINEFFPNQHLEYLDTFDYRVFSVGTRLEENMDDK